MSWQPYYPCSPYSCYWSGTSAPPPYSFATAQQSCVPLPTSTTPSVIPLPARRNWQWPHYTTTPLTPYSLNRQHLEPMPPSPDLYYPYYYVPPSPVHPYWEHSGDEAQAGICLSPCSGASLTVPRRRATRFLRRKSSSFHSPLKPKLKKLRNPPRSRQQVPLYRFSACWPIGEASLDSLNLAPRPNGWRIDYTPPHVARGLSRRISRTVRTAVEKSVGENPYSLSTLLHYTSASTHPIGYDIRHDPAQTNVQFLDLARPSNDIDFFQLATSPSVNELCLFHPRLPWYIHVGASHPNGITIGDILTQIHESLAKPINRRDFYNEELNAFDREEMSTAFYYRHGEDTGRGMLRMDFLGFDVMFLGLAKTKRGLWEIKTTEVIP